MLQSRSRSGSQAQLHGVSLWLLLLSILTHAVVPGGSPLQRTTGSAFSAWTAEVSLAPTRKLLLAEQEQQDAGDQERSGPGSGDGGVVAATTSTPVFVALLRDRVSPPIANWPIGQGAAPFQARPPPSV